MVSTFTLQTSVLRVYNSHVKLLVHARHMQCLSNSNFLPHYKTSPSTMETKLILAFLFQRSYFEGSRRISSIGLDPLVYLCVKLKLVSTCCRQLLIEVQILLDWKFHLCFLSGVSLFSSEIKYCTHNSSNHFLHINDENKSLAWCNYFLF